jgi:transcriptional regulator with XRE-family HTH domain
MALLPGKKLREMRRAREISQTEMARRIGISHQALGAIESDILSAGRGGSAATRQTARDHAFSHLLARYEILAFRVGTIVHFDVAGIDR